MRHFRKATIKEVAQRAGVSITTISKFVGGQENVCSPTTAERIRAAVSALHYTPSSLTRGLHRRAVATIGVCMHSPHDARIAHGSFFFERLWRGISLQADVEDYSLLQFPASVRDGESCDAFLDGRVDGMLFHSHDNARPERVAAAGMPAVVLTRSLSLPEGCGTAYADEAQSVDLALSHLWALGHRRIAHVAGPLGSHPLARGCAADGDEAPKRDDVAIRRLEGYVTWMRARSAYDPALIACARAWYGRHAPEIVAEWQAWSEPPTAVFCANDAQAVAIITAARERGWRVPEELSVVGVDDSTSARECRPALTSVNVPLDEIGREAVRALLRLMRGAPLEQCRVAVPVSELVVRASTAPPRAFR